MIGKLLNVGSLLARGDYEVDAEVVCDFVWLAAVGVGPSTVLRDSEVPGDRLPHSDPAGVPVPQKSIPGIEATPTLSSSTKSVGLYSPAGDDRGWAPGRRVKLSGAPAIARRLEIDRALRPLRGRYPSRYRLELDIEATVEAICESRHAMAVLEAARDRWLDVVLVVEQSPTMRVWQELAGDWRDAIQRAAGPRTLTFLWMEWLPAGLTLRTRLGDPVPARSVIVPGRATLIFCLTDAVGPGWMTADVPRQLDQWSRDAAVVVLDVLPRRLWDLSSLRRGLPAPPRDRAVVGPWRDGIRGLPGVFICCLDPREIGNLASHLTGRADSDVSLLPANAACFLDPEFNRFEPTAEFDPGQVSASEVDERYSEFIQFGSQLAVRVAQHIACVPDGVGLRLPLMRLIQRTLVPDAAPWQLAELFLSGLLYRVRKSESLPAELEYAFIGDIRQRLFGDAGTRRRVETKLLLSRYLQDRAGKGATFDAVVAADAETADTASEGEEPIATVPETLVGAEWARKPWDLGTVSSKSEPIFPPQSDDANGSDSPVRQWPAGVSATVYISCATSEFGAVRARLAQFLGRTRTTRLRHQSDFFRYGVKTLQALEEEIVKSDFVIHIIGAEPGSSPPPDQVWPFLDRNKGFDERFPAVVQLARGGQVSATQWEAWLALFFGKPLDAYEFPGRLLAGSPQKLHLERLHEARVHPKAVRDDDSLFEEIVGSLLERGLLSQEQTERKVAPSRITKHAPKILFGRERWLDALDEAWANQKLNVYTMVAWGGVGKTTLVAYWVSERMAAKGWPGVERYFDWSFYSQGTGESRQTSSDLFIHEALKFFDDPDPTRGSPWERGQRLAALIRRHRTLLILDGIEPLQYSIGDAQAGRLKDQALEALLLGLVADNPGLCIVTTRVHLKSIENYSTTAEVKLDGLTKDAAVELFRHLQVVGSEAEMEAAWRDAGGHALTLQLLGRFLADAHGGDIRRYKDVKFEQADLERHGRSAFKVMMAYERWLQSAGPERQRELQILRLTGLFDRPISRDILNALCAEPAIPGLTDALVKLNDARWNVSLKRLSEIDLLTVTPEAIDANPLIREYFSKQLRETQPAAIQAAHSRLFDHLRETTPYRPDTLDALVPLYQAVIHGCLARRHEEACDEVLIDRILRGTGLDGYYTTRTLGAMGADLAAIAAFFDEPWIRISANVRESTAAWLLNEVAFRLRALGRLTEAQEPMRAGFAMCVRQNDWENAAKSAGNLSELNVTLGRLSDAAADSLRAIDHADRSGDILRRVATRVASANALHQAGRRAEAGERFAEAERIQQAEQPQSAVLYSSQGFQYCDWLLAPAERAAWQALIARLEYRAYRETRRKGSPSRSLRSS